MFVLLRGPCQTRSCRIRNFSDRARVARSESGSILRFGRRRLTLARKGQKDVDGLYVSICYDTIGCNRPFAWSFR